MEDIPQNIIFMMSIIRELFELWPKYKLGDKVKKYFTLFEGDFSQMWFIGKEFDTQADFLANKMLKNPDWALKVIDQIELYSDNFFKEAAKVRKANLSKLSDKELIQIFKNSLKWQKLSHGIGASVSWCADTDQERVTKAIIKVIAGRIKENDVKISAMEALPVLSTPQKESLIQKEEKDFLKIANLLYQSSKLKKLFTDNHLGSIEENIKKQDKDLYQKIYRHYKKYTHLPYQYKGPSYSLIDFLGRWQAILSQKETPGAILERLEKEQKELFKKQKELMSRLNFNDYEKKLIKMAQRMVFIKDYRKAALYHGMYCYEPFFIEIAKRLDLSLAQVRAMNYWEIPDALLKKKFDPDHLNQRLKFCLSYYERGKGYKAIVGKEAREMLKKLEVEKVNIKNIKELTGTCACSGKVTGIVKIINVPEEMIKMEEGDILVAHNTNPNLVPAMKKASAMISESGGLTCHTAIVARELKTPCLVGVSFATKVLADGDKIEIDANKGLVKIIKKKYE